MFNKNFSAIYKNKDNITVLDKTLSKASLLSYIYLAGKYPGINKNYKKALKWNRLGAQLKYTNAYSNLAMMHAGGLGVEQNFIKTVQLLIKSFESYR